ncbi:MAG: endonuclease III [Firmicutes bacterium]|uniref:Endonuclease III n=1 Tax=Candidatus Scybalomonas excrementavium TaxID=2840943 RepID=A0A9D9N7V5_9FIRM|nr:endonuclease III [Candidatus Scybalomonas excrementavium]
MKKEQVQEILDKLDEVYGVTKEGFLHKEPWQLLLAIMLSAQSTDKQVEDVLPTLWKCFPSVESMANADVSQIEEQIKTIGLYKNKAKNMKKCCEQIVEQYGGEVPKTMEELVQLAGVGRKTANLFLSDAYGIPGITVDTHVMRIVKRFGWAKGKNPEEVEYELQKVLPMEHWIRINFQLIYHGRAICTARKAHCDTCIFADLCEKKIEKKEAKKKKESAKGQ